MPQIPLGMDHLVVLGMPPLENIRLAEAAGVQTISLMADQSFNPFGFAEWSLLDDRQLRRDTRAALADSAVALVLGEACRVEPGAGPDTWQPVIDLFAELGSPRVNCVSFQYDPVREEEQFEQLAGLVAAAGLTMCWEYSRRGRRNLAEVARQVRQLRGLGHRVNILIDPMHFIRGGEQVTDLAALEPGLVSYFQVCDVPLVGEGDYMDEALYRRLPPGDGELPLVEIVRALPPGVIYSMEIPQVPLFEAGVSHLDRVKAAAAKSRAMLAAAGLGA